MRYDNSAAEEMKNYLGIAFDFTLGDFSTNRRFAYPQDVFVSACIASKMAHPLARHFQSPVTFQRRNSDSIVWEEG